jgi:hypothetical protein
MSVAFESQSLQNAAINRNGVWMAALVRSVPPQTAQTAYTAVGRHQQRWQDHAFEQLAGRPAQRHCSYLWLQPRKH